jgi:hypothetical protein
MNLSFEAKADACDEDLSGVVGVAHHLESNSFEMYLAEDLLDLYHAQWHADCRPYERTVGFPHQTCTNFELQIFHDLKCLVMLMLKKLQLK